VESTSQVITTGATGVFGVGLGAGGAGHPTFLTPFVPALSLHSEHGHLA